METGNNKNKETINLENSFQAEESESSEKQTGQTEESTKPKPQETTETTLKQESDEVKEEEQEVEEEEKKEEEASSEEKASEESAESKSISMENFEQLVEDTLRQPEEGEIVHGTVIRIGKENVMVDIGYKSEGQVPISEFTDESGNVTVNKGDQVDVLIERREDENGIIQLSKDKADKVKIWEELEKAYKNQTPVEGVISGKVKGGMTVDIGVKAFLPGSQLDLRPTRNHDSFVGEKGVFDILKFNRRRGNIVVSRRSVLEREREEKKKKTLQNIEKGRIMTGTVKNIVDYGAFIDLGGIDGLLHITDMSWGRIKHPSEILKAGEEIKVVILKYDEQNERVSLGLKQITPDPWDTVDEKYPVGSKVTGKVVSITDYGAFIELEPGVEGLVHVSEMSWTRKIKHPSKILQVGQQVEVMVLDIKPEDRRISLGLKQVEPNPWDVIEEKYPSGSIIKGKVRNVTDFGIFVGVEEGIDGLVHISDISWTKRIKHPGELYKKGQEIEAMVLNIDKEHERFSLGIKQLTKDPWEDIRERMRPGDMAKGKVVNATDFGVFLELEEGVEGLIHISELGLEKDKSPSEAFKPGTELTVEILNIDPKERKIRLSLKAVEEKDEKEDIRQYVQARNNGTVKIGDILGTQLADKLKTAVGEPSAQEKEPSETEQTAEPGEREQPEAEPETAAAQETAGEQEHGPQPETEVLGEQSEPEPEPEEATGPEEPEPQSETGRMNEQEKPESEDATESATTEEEDSGEKE